MKIINKKAKFEYEIIDDFEAGISLTGAEVKAFKRGSVDMSKAYVKIMSGEAFLINANFESENVAEHSRTRKLLLHKKEIEKITSKSEALKLTIVPVWMYNKARLVKLKIALARHKKEFEKREKIKKRDLQREIERELRGKRD